MSVAKQAVSKHRFTVEEYHRMGEAGIFHEDDRVELIDGEVVEMAAIGKRHVESVMRLNRLLLRWVLLEAPQKDDTEFFVSPQNPLTISEYGEPEPDLVLVRRSVGRSGIPEPEDALVVVEVSDSSLVFDRNVKLPRYAEAGIPEVWILNLKADETEIHSEPGPGGYGRVVRHRRGERIVSATVPGLAFDAGEALPPETLSTES